MDGGDDEKLNDYGVAVKGGSDGNGYIVGYSLRQQTSNETELVQVPVVIIVSPTGRTLLRQNIDLGDLLYQKVVAMEILESSSSTSTRSIFILGESKADTLVDSPTKLSISGIELLDGAVTPFAGFDGVVDSASAATSPTPTATASDGAENTPILAKAGGALGVIAVLVAVTALIIVRMRSTGGSKIDRSEMSLSPVQRAPAQMQ